MQVRSENSLTRWTVTKREITTLYTDLSHLVANYFVVLQVAILLDIIISHLF